MLSTSVRARQGLSSTPRTSIAQKRPVRARIFRRDVSTLVEDNSGAGLEGYQEPPTKRQRENVKKTLMDLGFTEQASDILAYGKITNSNADLLIGDIRASFGLYQPLPPAGPVEQVQNSVQGLLDRLKLPFLGLVLAAGAYAAYSAQVTTMLA